MSSIFPGDNPSLSPQASSPIPSPHDPCESHRITTNSQSEVPLSQVINASTVSDPYCTSGGDYNDGSRNPDNSNYREISDTNDDTTAFPGIQNTMTAHHLINATQTEVVPPTATTTNDLLNDTTHFIEEKSLVPNGGPQTYISGPSAFVVTPTVHLESSPISFASSSYPTSSAISSVPTQVDSLIPSAYPIEPATDTHAGIGSQPGPELRRGHPSLRNDAPSALTQRASLIISPGQASQQRFVFSFANAATTTGHPVHGARSSIQSQPGTIHHDAHGSQFESWTARTSMTTAAGTMANQQDSNDGYLDKLLPHFFPHPPVEHPNVNQPQKQDEVSHLVEHSQRTPQSDTPSLTLEDMIKPIHCLPMKESAMYPHHKQPDANPAASGVKLDITSTASASRLPPQFVKRYVLASLGLSQGLKPELSKDGTGGTYFLCAGDLVPLPKPGSSDLDSNLSDITLSYPPPVLLRRFIDENFNSDDFSEEGGDSSQSDQDQQQEADQTDSQHRLDKPDASQSQRTELSNNQSFPSSHRTGSFATSASLSTFRASHSMSGLSDLSNVKVLVFKPQDEEAYAPNNPRGHVGALGHFSFRPGIRSGEGHGREIAAWLLDHESFAGVPVTVAAEIPTAAFANDVQDLIPPVPQIEAVESAYTALASTANPTTPVSPWAAWCSVDPALKQLATGATDPLVRASARNLFSTVQSLTLAAAAHSHVHGIDRDMSTTSGPLTSSSQSFAGSFKDGKLLGHGHSGVQSMSNIPSASETDRHSKLVDDTSLTGKLNRSADKFDSESDNETMRGQSLDDSYETERAAFLEALSKSKIPQAALAAAKAQAATSLPVEYAPAIADEQASVTSSDCPPSSRPEPARVWKPRWKIRQEAERAAAEAAALEATNKQAAAPADPETTMTTTATMASQDLIAKTSELAKNSSVQEDPTHQVRLHGSSPIIAPNELEVSSQSQTDPNPVGLRPASNPWKPKWKIRKEIEEAAAAATAAGTAAATVTTADSVAAPTMAPTIVPTIPSTIAPTTAAMAPQSSKELEPISERPTQQFSLPEIIKESLISPPARTTTFDFGSRRFSTQACVTPSAKRRGSRYTISKTIEIPEPALNQPLELGRIASLVLTPTVATATLQSPIRKIPKGTDPHISQETTTDSSSRPESGCSVRSMIHAKEVSHQEGGGSKSVSTMSRSDSNSSSQSSQEGYRNLGHGEFRQTQSPVTNLSTIVVSAATPIPGPASPMGGGGVTPIGVGEDMTSAQRASEAEWLSLSKLARTFSSKHFVGPEDSHVAVVHAPSPSRVLPTSFSNMSVSLSPTLGPSSHGWAQQGFASPGFAPTMLPATSELVDLATLEKSQSSATPVLVATQPTLSILTDDHTLDEAGDQAESIVGDLPHSLIDRMDTSSKFSLNDAIPTPQTPASISTAVLARKKIGSLQEFVVANSTSEDISYSLFPDKEVQKIAVLDLRMLNLDRNTANVLVRRRKAPHHHKLPHKSNDCETNVCTSPMSSARAQNHNVPKVPVPSISQHQQQRTASEPQIQSTPFFSPVQLPATSITSGLTPMFLPGSTTTASVSTAGGSVMPPLSLNDPSSTTDQHEQHVPLFWSTQQKRDHATLKPSTKRPSVSGIPASQSSAATRQAHFSTLPSSIIVAAAARRAQGSSSRATSPIIPTGGATPILAANPSAHAQKAVAGFESDDEALPDDEDSHVDLTTHVDRFTVPTVRSSTTSSTTSLPKVAQSNRPAIASSQQFPGSLAKVFEPSAFDNVHELLDELNSEDSDARPSVQTQDRSPTISLAGFVFDRSNDDRGRGVLQSPSASRASSLTGEDYLGSSSTTLSMGGVDLIDFPLPDLGNSKTAAAATSAGTSSSSTSSVSKPSMPQYPYGTVEEMVQTLYRFDRYRASVADSHLKQQYHDETSSLRSMLTRPNGTSRHHSNHSKRRGGCRSHHGHGRLSGRLRSSHGSSTSSELITLIPIDHAYTLPDTLSLEEDYLCWLAWPQAARPCVPEVLEYVRSLDVERDAQILAQHPTLQIRPPCLKLFKVAGITLQKALDRGFTLRDVGLMLCKRVVERDAVTGKFRRASSWLNNELDDAWIWSDEDAKTAEETAFEKDGESSSDCSLDDDDEDLKGPGLYDRESRVERGRVEFQSHENDDELPCEISQLLDQCEALAAAGRALTKVQNRCRQGTVLSHALVHAAAMRRGRVCRGCGKRFTERDPNVSSDSTETASGYVSVSRLQALQILLSDNSRGDSMGEVNFKFVLEAHKRSNSAPPAVRYRPWESFKTEPAPLPHDSSQIAQSPLPPPADIHDPASRSKVGPTLDSKFPYIRQGHGRGASEMQSQLRLVRSQTLLPDSETPQPSPKVSPESSPKPSPTTAVGVGVLSGSSEVTTASISVSVPAPAPLAALALPPLSSPCLPITPVETTSIRSPRSTFFNTPLSNLKMQRSQANSKFSKDSTSSLVDQTPNSQHGTEMVNQVIQNDGASAPLSDEQTVDKTNGKALVSPSRRLTMAELPNNICMEDIKVSTSLDLLTDLARDSMLETKQEYLKNAPLYSPLYFFTFTDLLLLARDDEDFILLAFRKLLDGFLDFKMAARCMSRERDMAARLAARREWVNRKLARRQKREQHRLQKLSKHI